MNRGRMPLMSALCIAMGVIPEPHVRRTRPVDDLTGPTVPPELLRCDVTSNPCGTDTWAVGHPCHCAPCQEWLKAQPPSTPIILFDRHNGDTYDFRARWDQPLTRASRPAAGPADPAKKRRRKAQQAARKANRGNR